MKFAEVKVEPRYEIFSKQDVYLGQIVHEQGNWSYRADYPEDNLDADDLRTIADRLDDLNNGLVE